MYKFTLIVLITLLSSFRLLPGHETDKAVMTAAEGQLPALLSKMTPDDENKYGFTEADDLDDCTIGKPYRELIFSNEFYSSDLDDDKDYVLTKNEWRVPVMIKGYNRNLLTVSGAPGNYIVSNMGDTALAQELQLVSKNADVNDTYYLLHVSRISADFFVYEANNSFAEAKFIPLESAISAIPSLSNTKKPPYTLNEVQQIVKQALAEGRKQTVSKKIKQGVPVKKNTATNSN